VSTASSAKPAAGGEPWVVTILAMLLSVPVTYAILRGKDALFGHEVNPALVVYSAKIAMFWRLGIAVYVAGMVAPLAFFGARRDLARAVTALYAFTLVSATLIALQGLLLP
jgi:hypothetical protein